MSWAAIIVGGVGMAVSAGGSYLSSSSKQSAGEDAIAGAAGSNAFGKVPEAAEYKPVNFDKVQLNTILGNARNRQPLYELTSVNNDETTRQALRRARKMLPGYDSMMRSYASAGSDLLNAQVPYDDVLGIVSDRNEMANTLGIPGAGAMPATLKDLGMTRMGAIQMGGGIMKDMVGMAETINPIARHDTPAAWMLHPADRIKFEMDQHQLIQQSDQNKNNLEAAGDPTAYGMLQLQLAQAGSAGASPAGSALSAAGSGISMMGSLYGGGGSSGLGSGARLNTSGMRPGPQPGTYYV